ncbi:hypothetical protein ACV1DX_23905, partial [Aeromonas caviae]
QAGKWDQETIVSFFLCQYCSGEYLRIIDANQKRVREAPTLHEWNIRVRNPHAWLIISIPIGILILIGAWLALGDNMASIGWGFIIMGGLALYFRYLVMADKDYHYRLTSEGLIAIYQDSIPNIAYKIVRGLAWLGVLVCIISVAVLGPLSLVGAGGMALFAIVSIHQDGVDGISSAGMG